MVSSQNTLLFEENSELNPNISRKTRTQFKGTGTEVQALGEQRKK